MAAFSLDALTNRVLQCSAPILLPTQLPITAHFKAELFSILTYDKKPPIGYTFVLHLLVQRNCILYVFFLQKAFDTLGYASLFW